MKLCANCEQDRYKTNSKASLRDSNNPMFKGCHGQIKTALAHGQEVWNKTEVNKQLLGRGVRGGLVALCAEITSDLEPIAYDSFLVRPPGSGRGV